MKKLISASKRKWVLGGILGFAAIALTTTGFATWIVGVNATTTNSDVGVTVDTVSNNGVELTLVLGSDTQIELKEKNVSEGVVTVTGNDTVENPLQISVETFTLEVGKQFLNTNTITGVEFALKYETDKDTLDIKDNASNKVTDNKIGSDKRTSSELGYWEYISAPAKIEFTNEDITTSGDQSTYTYQINASTLDFEWGSFFGGDSPATFYNTIFKNATKDDVDNIVAELDAMNTALNTGKTLVLTASLAYKAK